MRDHRMAMMLMSQRRIRKLAVGYGAPTGPSPLAVAGKGRPLRPYFMESPAPAAVIEDLQRMLSNDEARNKVLEQKYEEQQATNAGLKEKMVGLKS
ncbi:hypothetical protein LIER_14848 [Lithospermum erythrorhizon]|uniref:Uncharacterized protein n=1 Tax=Lithospermum erythrorhizon TaxID=34254 RepID=A0AAV3Q2V6_LITER